MTQLIPLRAAPPHRPTLSKPADLVESGLVRPGAQDALERVAARYAIGITSHIADLIDPDDADDPIARQFVPDPRELVRLPEENPDPIGDERFSPLPQLVHRYPDRVLLKIVSVCPVYCRFCFRREMVGPGGASLTGADFDAAVDYIASDARIFEVILTGGDPFMLSARRVKQVTDRLAAIPHVKVLRWHTRVPMVDPDRITPDFVQALKARGISTWVAIHANHAREFVPDAEAAIGRLAEAGVALVSQSVLLKGINNSLEALEELMRAFVANGVKPYYLHHPDLAPGTSHFRLSIEEGQGLVDALRARATGLAQPTYVLDVPGGASKAPLSLPYVDVTGDEVRVRDGAVWRPYSESL
jgi:lysine 2,3-aminomutase